jgi:Glycosyl hydrolase catalytic core/Beta-galactosidase
MRRRAFALTALLAVVSVGALAGAGTAAAAGPPGFFGLVPQGEEPSNADIERMGRGNVGMVRLVANWGLIEPTDDAWNFGALDDYIGELAESGIRPFPVLFHTSPFVGSDDIRLPVHSAKDKEEWKEFVAMVVDRYGPGGAYWTTQYEIDHPGAEPMPIEALQVWNEQNGSKHARDPNPSEYAELVEISNEAIDGVDPGVEVVLGGMFGSPRGGGGIPGAKFLKRAYGSAGFKEAFDGVAVHPYSPDVDGIEEQIEDIRKVLKKKKDKGADMWLTELGWGSSKKGRLGVGKKEQAKLLKQSFRLLLKKRGKWHVGGVMWYTWRDLPKGESPCDWCSSAGLFKTNGTKPKPAWKQFVRFTGGS